MTYYKNDIITQGELIILNSQRVRIKRKNNKNQ